MLLLILFALVAFSICEGFIIGALNGDVRQGKASYVYILVCLEILIGFFLCWLVSFNIQFYDSAELDFFDYGEITTEGIIYSAIWLLGVYNIIYGSIRVLRLLTGEIKSVLCSIADSVASKQENVSFYEVKETEYKGK